jgi:hypothetical protein
VPSPKSAADQRDAVWNTAGRIERWQRMRGSGAQSLRAFPKPARSRRAVRERGMSGEIGDGEHFVAQRGNQQQIDLRERSAFHFERNFTAKTVGLHKVNGR